MPTQIAINYPQANFTTQSVHLRRVRATPVYGWNIVRWLLKRPKHYVVSYDFTVLPPAGTGNHDAADPI